jgi:hypothetical protein
MKMTQKQEKSLENLLKATVAKGKGSDKKEVPAEFTLSLNPSNRATPEISIGNGDLALDFTVVGNKIIPHFVNTDATGMDFGEATDCALRGDCVAREGWNGKGMKLMAQLPDENSKMTVPYFYLEIPECEEGVRRIPYTPTMIDTMSGDWLIVPTK